MKFFDKKVNLVTALSEELAPKIKNQFFGKTLTTGIGKVNAAMNFMKFIQQRNEVAGKGEIYINLGTCGSIAYVPGTIVCVSRFAEFDMNLYPLLAPMESISSDGSKESCIVHLEHINTTFAFSPCCTADTFFSEDLMLQYGVVDMEGFALAKVAHFMDVPFFSLKIVSDSGNIGDWKLSLEKNAEKLAEALPRFLCELENHLNSKKIYD